MSDYTSTSRKTSTATILESFMDRFSIADYEQGFESLMEDLEVVAEEIDDEVIRLEHSIDELQETINDYESEILELRNQIEQLEEEQ